MSIYKGAVRSAGNEMDFLTAFDTAFQALDSAIERTGYDIPEVYASSADGYDRQPYVEYTVSGVYKITIKRGSKLTRSSSPIAYGDHVGKYGFVSGASVSHYHVYVYHIPTETEWACVNANYGLKFCSGSEYVHKNVVREWMVGLVKNAKALIVQLSPYNRSLVDVDPLANILLVTDSNTHVFRMRMPTSSSTITDSEYRLDNKSTVTAVNRLPYYRDQTDESKISMIGSKVFTDVTSACVLTTDALIDCSTLSVLNRRIVINGQTHYVLNAHTLVPVS